jgi:gliding motility-associated-like protein
LGNDGSKNYNDFWEYNPVTNTWTQMSNYPGNPRMFAVGIAISGKGYVGTGADTAVYYDDWKEFNSTTNSWATMTNFPGGARYHMVGFGLGCRGYIGTGHYTNGGMSGSTVWKNDWWEFAPYKVQFANINTAGSATICPGSSATLIASGGNIYNWSTGSTATSIVVAPASATTYSVIVTSTGYMCVDTAFIKVVAMPITLSTSNVAVYCGSSLGSASVNIVSGGVPPYTYLWIPTNQTTATATGLPASGIYTVTVTDVTGCVATTTVQVVSLNSPMAVVTGTMAICQGDSSTLTASGGNTYSWSNGSTSTSIVVSPSSTTTYSVVASLGTCWNIAKVIVTVYPPPIAHIVGNTNICQGFAAILTATGGGTYSWSSGETSAVVNPATAGTYSVIVTIGTCTDTASTTIYFHSLPTANVSPDVTIVQGQSTDLFASGGVNYVWSNLVTGANNVVDPQHTTEYCVTVYDANNCRDTACVNVFVIPCESAGELFLPDAFSPNGDGENDELRIYFGLFDCIQSFHLVIYNRWGEKIYQTNDPSFKWNGIYNKGVLKNTDLENSEVFVYYMNVGIGDGSKISRKGNVSLIR